MTTSAPPSPHVEDTKGDTFSLGETEDQKLFKEFKDANQILMNGGLPSRRPPPFPTDHHPEDDVTPVLEKIERTFERIFQTDSDVAPGPLDYF